MKRTLIAALLSLIAAPPALAQEVRLHDVRIGWSSDRVLSAFKGAYSVIDTVRSMNSDGEIIRLAPIALSGIDGFLVLHVDTAGTITDVYWTRVPYGRYARSEALSAYTGWNSWQKPSASELNRLVRDIESSLGKASKGTLVPMRIDGDREAAMKDSMQMFSWSVPGTHLELSIQREDVELSVKSRSSFVPPSER